MAFGTGANGRWWLHADLDADLGQLIETALDEARDAVFQRENRTGDTTDPDRVFRPVGDIDAWVEMAHRSLDTINEPSRRNRYRVNLQLDLDGTVRTNRGDRLPDSIARHLTCDGSIDPVFVRAAKPVSVGRTQRTIPDRTRRTVLHRDAHCCQVPGCTATRGLDLHHIVHWADGGSTDTANLVVLCARHHRLHHRHRLGIAGNADDPGSVVFTDARGHPIRASGADPHPPNGPPEPIRGEYLHPLGERLESRWVSFVNPDIPAIQRRHQYPDLARPDLYEPDRYPDTG
ncbi:HNH endonuclease [Ilumatobacter nonamiensis]|uniref:HNH endonuclease n=1 Tax=Ilumatobacter nonamiensis TaxID=467093 RepID=UPI000349B947|nr:HNH endonuclease signature motif containing protein [Ilumatobacter nonamiensis]